MSGLLASTIDLAENALSVRVHALLWKLLACYFLATTVKSMRRLVLGYANNSEMMLVRVDKRSCLNGFRPVFAILATVYAAIALPSSE